MPERPLHDQFILKPIVQRLFEDLGRPARVELLPDLAGYRGVDRILDQAILREIVMDRPMIQLFLLFVDRDCVEGRENLASVRAAEHPGRMLECVAIEELEVWMLALHRQELAAGWADVRRECHPKEVYAAPFLSSKRWGGPGEGRKRALRELGKGWNGLLTVCPELNALKSRIAAWLEAQAAE